MLSDVFATARRLTDRSGSSRVPPLRRATSEKPTIEKR
jgi:hypothetical protein